MFGVEGTSSLHFATNAKMIGGGLDEQLKKFVILNFNTVGCI